MTILITGLLLGGTYALIAIGLTLQYGVARIMNLAYGEVLIAAAFITFVLFSSYGLSPLWSLFIIVPLGYGLSFLIYRVTSRGAVRFDRTETSKVLATSLYARRDGKWRAVLYQETLSK